MPGNTENTNILTGINQVIQALNSLNVPTEVDGIVDKLEKIRVAIVEDTALRNSTESSNFYALIGAIQALTLSCQTIVNTTQLNQTISCGGSGSRGTGTWPAPESPQTTTPEDQAGDPPPGFASWSEYNTYKCDMAYKIVNDMIADISVTGLLAAGAATVGTLGPLLVAALLTPIGWAEIIVMATLFITLLSYGVSIATLSTLLEVKKDEFVCALLAGSSVSTSIGEFADLCDDKVASDATLGALPEFLQSQVSSAIKAYATVDSINQLYEKSAVPPPTGNNCPCTEGCTTPLPVQPDIYVFQTPGDQQQELISFSNGVLRLRAANTPSWGNVNAYDLAFSLIPDGFIIQSYSIIEGGPLSQVSGQPIYWAYEDLSQPFGGSPSTSDVGFTLPSSLGSLFVLSIGPFAMEFVLCERPE